MIFNDFIKKLYLQYWAVHHISAAAAVNTRKKQPETCLLLAALQIILVYTFQLECVGKVRKGKKRWAVPLRLYSATS